MHVEQSEEEILLSHFLSSSTPCTSSLLQVAVSNLFLLPLIAEGTTKNWLPEARMAT